MSLKCKMRAGARYEIYGRRDDLFVYAMTGEGSDARVQTGDKASRGALKDIRGAKPPIGSMKAAAGASWDGVRAEQGSGG